MPHHSLGYLYLCVFVSEHTHRSQNWNSHCDGHHDYGGNCNYRYHHDQYYGTDGSCQHGICIANGLMNSLGTFKISGQLDVNFDGGSNYGIGAALSWHIRLPSFLGGHTYRGGLRGQIKNGMICISVGIAGFHFRIGIRPGANPPLCLDTGGSSCRC